MRTLRSFLLQWLTLSGLSLLALFAVGSRQGGAAVSSARPQGAPIAVSHRAKVETEREKSCRKFVQGFYDWYVQKEISSEGSGSTGGSGSTSDDVLRFKPDVLSLKLRRMLKEEYATNAKMNGSLDLQLEFVPYLNAQDDVGAVRVRTATYRAGKCRASVWLTDPGAERDQVDPELVLQNGKWVIVNFHYPDPETPSDENLIDMIIQLRKDRAKAKTEGAPL